MALDLEETVIRKEVLRDKIFSVLKEWILDGTLKPGDRVVELQISKKLQVSRAPLREALWLLSHHGLVTIKAHQGSFVTRLSDRDLREIFELREILETLAARRVRATLTEQGAARLREALGRLEEAARCRQIPLFTEADFEFHKTLWSLAENKQLEEILTQISTRFFGYELIRDLRHAPAFKFEEMFEVHRRMVCQVLKGTEAEVDTCFREAFQTFLNYVLARFAEQERADASPRTLLVL